MPGCTGDGPSEKSYCVKDPDGSSRGSESNSNGATVLSVNVVPSDENLGQEPAGVSAAELEGSENSSVRATSVLLATAMASTTVFLSLI